MLFVCLFGRHIGTTAIRRKQIEKVKKSDVIVITGCCQACKCLHVNLFSNEDIASLSRAAR